MSRVFFRTFYIFFLWIILMANLFIAFDLVSLIINPVQSANTGSDLSNKYFGVSTLINALKSIDSLPIGKAARWANYIQDQFFKIANDMFNLELLQESFVNIGNSDNFLEVLKNIAYLLYTLTRGALSLFMYLICAIYFLLYQVILFLTLVYTLTGLMGGYYANDMPTHYLWNVASNISNSITPLLTAV